MFVGFEDGSLVQWNTEDIRDKVVIQVHKGAIVSATISKNGRYLVTGSKDRTAKVWDLQNHTPWQSAIELAHHEDKVSLLGISPDGTRIVTAGH